MTDQKVKKRGWVKNAAIIFLAVMLALTFFSNTIMNHSLPEVAAQYVQSGTISAKIRGTGTVAANESYEVKSEQSREVLSVPVQVGQEVKVGDTLVYFADAESSQLKEAQDALDALILAYQKALINASDSDYTKENRDIELARKALDKAKAEAGKYYVTTSDIAAAKTSYNTDKATVAAQQSTVDNLTEEFSGLSQGTDNSAAIAAKSNEITAAQTELDAAMLAYKVGYDNLTTCATAWRASVAESVRKELSVYKEALAQKFAALLTSVGSGTFPAAVPADIFDYTSTTAVAFDKATVTAMKDAFNAIDPLQTSLSTLQTELMVLSNSGGGSYNYYYVKNQLTEAKNLLAALTTTMTTQKEILDSLEEKLTKYEAAQATVETNQKTLEDLMFALAQTQKTDGKTQASEALDLAAQQKQIEGKKEDLAELKEGGEGAEINSKVNGIVAAVSISAGKTAEADSVLMTIEVPDMGYGVNISVTTEQSKKVSLGDTAEVTNYYSSDPLTATLVAIKSDPQNPTTNKLLSFKLQGEVESGTQLSLAIGERGGNYETIVPNSAIRSDNNGKFVLAVIAKNSPLGNRYIAQRIDVQVLATDDANSAVSGGITTSDFVITTSTKPVEPGTQVRLSD